MTHRRFSLAWLATLLLGLTSLSLHAAAADAVGHWEGAIELPGTQLGIRVDLTAADAGTIDIPVQGLRGFALGDVSADTSQVSFRMPNIPGDPTFEGTVADDGQRITGTFTQNGQSFPFHLERHEKATTTQGETPSHGVPGEGLAGHWQGTLRVGPAQLRLALHVNQNGDTLTATVDSLDQGAMGLTVDSISLSEGKVSFKMNAIRASYAGTMAEDGSEIVGTWTQGPGSSPLTFRRLPNAEAATLKRPQEPTKPYPYDEREVAFTGGADGVTLAGTLTTPGGEGPFPAVVLLTGSGPQDRNETLMGHRPFLVLADHLTRRGIVVLRYDDRGFGQSTGNFGTATHDDFADDGRAALEFLQQQPGVDPERVGLLGHSEGGVYAPLIAADHDDVAFIVMLAGVGVPVEQLLQRQGQDLMRVSGINEEARAQQHEVRAAIFATLREHGPTDTAREKIRARLQQELSRYTPEQRQAMGMTDGAVEQQVAMMTTPWFTRLLDYDPAAALAQVQCPVLALNGGKDLQVAAEENLEGVRAGLAAGGNTNVTTKTYPDLNHLFQTADTGAFAEYGSIEETMNPEVLTTVAEWILEITRV